ncbi:MAG TPA: hypothetical protein V6C69_14360 [Trichormus sp.]|jgi:F0F1-type ATP synthase membrane subunit b/b'
MDFLLQLFRNNLINWLLLLAALVYFWRKYTPTMFDARKQRIETMLRDAASAKEQGENLLQDVQKKIASVEEDVQGILNEAKNLAAQLEQQMRDQTVTDLADMEKRITAQIKAEEQLAIIELRAAAARAAIKLTEQTLPSLINDDTKSQLLSQFMEQLDNAAQQGPKVSAGSLESIR